MILSFAASAERAYKLQPDREKILSPAITEASGLAVSPTNKDFLWVGNDSGGTPEIHLSRTNGTPHGAVIISGARNIDWEDLASFHLNGKSYLLIADTGDNNAARQTSSLYIVREPEISAEGKIISGKIPIAWEIVFSYEGGPRDCEAVAVDPGSGKILLLSKRTEPPILYKLPLRPE
ncbi:MAG: hypothetical protein H7Y36_03605, partial [Armatimonadetes bacterium]|nr:hypothetical protein [Akkermansiaceae bacterium]